MGTWIGESINYLANKPYAQYDQRRHLDYRKEKSEKQQRVDIGFGKRHRISPEYRRHGAACSDNGDKHCWKRREIGMAHRRTAATQQIKKQEPAVAQAVFDVYSKQPQEPHIAQQMQHPTVQKH